MSEVSLDELKQYMQPGDQVNDKRFAKEIVELGDEGTKKLVSIEPTPLWEAARDDAIDAIDACLSQIEQKQHDCPMTSCKILSDPTVNLLARFKESVTKNSWTGMSGMKASRKPSLGDLLAIKARSRADTAALLPNLDRLIQEHQSSSQTLQQEQQEQIQSSSTGIGKKIIIIAVVGFVVLLVLVIVLYFAVFSKSELYVPDVTIAELYPAPRIPVHIPGTQ